MKHVLGFFTVLAALAALAAVHCGTPDRRCTLLGCTSGYTTRVPLPVRTSDTPHLRVTICRNGVCSSGVPTVQCGGDASCPRLVELTLTGPLGAFASFVPDEPGGGEVERYTLDIGVPAETRAKRDALKNGDAYAVKVEWTDGRGPPIIDSNKTITYKKLYPNGEDCDGKDGFCLSAAD